MTDQNSDPIVAAYLGGDSLRVIAERRGVTKAAVHRYLLRRGVKMRPRGWRMGKSRKRT